MSSSAFFGFSLRNSFPISEYSFILTGCSHFIDAIVAWISLRILRIIFSRQNILLSIYGRVWFLRGLLASCGSGGGGWAFDRASSYVRQAGNPSCPARLALVWSWVSFEDFVLQSAAFPFLSRFLPLLRPTSILKETFQAYHLLS